LREEVGVLWIREVVEGSSGGGGGVGGGGHAAMDGGDGGVVVGGRGAAGIAEGVVGRGELFGVF